MTATLGRIAEHVSRIFFLIGGKLTLSSKNTKAFSHLFYQLIMKREKKVLAVECLELHAARIVYNF